MDYKFLDKKMPSFGNYTAQKLKEMFYSSFQHWNAKKKYFKNDVLGCFPFMLCSLQTAVKVLYVHVEEHHKRLRAIVCKNQTKSEVTITNFSPFP